MGALNPLIHKAFSDYSWIFLKIIPPPEKPPVIAEMSVTICYRDGKEKGPEGSANLLQPFSYEPQIAHGGEDLPQRLGLGARGTSQWGAQGCPGTGPPPIRI